VLTEWRDAGWERIFGRRPTDDDLIVPTRNLTMRESPEAQKALHDDLELLKLRPRRGHDLRRTFITLAQVDGARKDILEAISHGPRGDIVSVYTTFPWPVLCAEVAKLKIEPAVVRIPRGLVDKTRYTAVTGEQSSRNRWTKRATPAGFEPFRGASTTTVARRGLASNVEASREVRTRALIPARAAWSRPTELHSRGSWQPGGNDCMRERAPGYGSQPFSGVQAGGLTRHPAGHATRGPMEHPPWRHTAGATKGAAPFVHI